MDIRTTAATPAPDQNATAACSFAIGPWRGVLERRFRTGATDDQAECLSGAAEGDVIVGFDASGRVKSMHLMVGNRFVPMQDGFETAHVRILLGNLGDAGLRRDNALLLAEQLSRMSTGEEAAAEEGHSSREDLDTGWHLENSEALDSIIDRARKLLHPLRLEQPEPAASPEI